MLSPLVKTLCCLLGLAAAGAPLLWLTAPPAVEPPPAQAAESEAEAMLLTLRCSGRPQALIIRHEGCTLCDMPMGSAEMQPGAEAYRTQLKLPRPAPGSALELELQITWPEDAQGPQAATLELTPRKLPTRSDTRWTPPGSHVLHDIFSFTW